MGYVVVATLIIMAIALVPRGIYSFRFEFRKAAIAAGVFWGSALLCVFALVYLMLESP